MKLFDLLETAKQTQDIITRDNSKIGIIYSERYNCFIWCYNNGMAIETNKDYVGYERVILSSKLLEYDDWYLIPTKKEKDKSKDIQKIYVSEKGWVVDSPDSCQILCSCEDGATRAFIIDKKKCTIENKSIIR